MHLTLLLGITAMMNFQNATLATLLLLVTNGAQATDWNLTFNWADNVVPDGLTYNIVLDDTVAPTSVIPEGTEIHRSSFIDSRGVTITDKDLYVDTKYIFNKSIFKQFELNYRNTTITVEDLGSSASYLVFNDTITNGAATKASFRVGNQSTFIVGEYPGPYDGQSEVITPNSITYYSHVPKVGSGSSYFLGSRNEFPFYSEVLSITGINLAPVPEPETYALLLAGLGFMGFVARRKSV